MKREVKTHGHWGYQCGCRCDVCTAAHTNYMRQYRVRHPKGDDVHTHSMAGYVRGCRCDVCTTANAHYRKEQRAQRVEVIPILTQTQQEQLVLDLVYERITESEFIARGGKL